MPSNPIGASTTGTDIFLADMVVEVSRLSTSTSTRWRSLIASMSATLARNVLSV